MKSPRPGILALRAVNQYRRRDVIPYLALRYYLESAATRTDRWAREVAIDLLLRRTNPTYLRVQHFKDVDDRGNVGHRDMFLPGPNEALAEAALIDACATAGGTFALPNCVFSYAPATGAEASGIFVPYMRGLRARHEAISFACKRSPKARIAFVDIKRFYPSIRVDMATTAWKEACANSRLSPTMTEAGLRLLRDHGIASKEYRGRLLTGPMFSHVIGNLFLRRVDEKMSGASAAYFRYVDDIALVGTPQEVHSSMRILRGEIEALGLELHDDSSSKTLNIGAEEWLQGEHDFAETRSDVSWMTLVGDLKRFLLWHPNRTPELAVALKNSGYRIPVPDYSGAVQEAAFVDRLRMLMSKTWFQMRAQGVTIDSILRQASILRERYDAELLELLENADQLSVFALKRVLPKARYRLGRLAYLARPERLLAMAEAAIGVPGLRLQAEVGRAIATGEVDRILMFGTNATQAAAQPLRMAHYQPTLSRETRSKVDLNSIAILKFSGVAGQLPSAGSGGDELIRFAQKGSDAQLMNSADPFIREIACLHGVADSPRHLELLDKPLDQAEDVALDAIEQARQSLSL